MQGDCWDHKFVVTDTKRLIGDCAHLIIRESGGDASDEDRVVLAHFSVKEFLISSLSMELPRHIFHPVKAPAMLADRVFKFL
jgi:hypothetical protein